MNRKQRDLQKLVAYNGSMYFDATGAIAKLKKQHAPTHSAQPQQQQPQQHQQYY